MFSISCSNEDKTGSDDGNSGGSGNGGYGVTGSGVAADLEGRWGGWNYMGITNGLLTLPSTPPYRGQIPNSFNYPFSIVLTSTYGSETGTGIFTFYNSTNGAYYFQTASTGSGGKVNWYIQRGSSYKN